MNSFGLGLVLNFVDNASSGMNTATNSFLQMSATADSMTSSISASATELASMAFSLGAVGNTFTSIGESITGVFAGITQQVISAGGQMQGYRMQLAALYGSAEAGEAKMNEIKQYAMSSVFEIESLIPAVTMMKAVGIEAMQDITTSSGQATQKLLDYASDLAAMMPNMRNVYGTGVSAAMGAFKEYIAEGNAMSLKRGAGLDITAMLGEEKGATAEERTQQIADLIEKLDILGYTANLAGTPTQRLSNMQDALFNTLTRVADSGVFEVYCTLLEKLSNWIFSLVEDEETFNAITGILADTVTSILSPLESMLDWVIANSNAIIEWIKNNPVLTKNILTTVAAIGAFLIAGGSLLKMLSSIAFAMSGFKMLGSLPLLLGKVVIAALPLIAVAGLAYTAWSENMGGIRDSVLNLMTNLGSIMSILGDAWSDNTLSEENFLKANQLGILPLISGILQLKYYWDFFVEGFKAGFKGVFEGLFNTLSAFGIDVEGLGEKFSAFLTKLSQPGAEDEWVKLGEVIGEIIASVALLALAVKILTPVFKLIIGIGKAIKWVGGVANTLKKVFNFIGEMKIWGKIAGGIKAVGTVLKGGQGVGVFTKLLEVIKAVASGGIGLKDAFTIVFGAVGTTITGVISLIVGIAGAVVGFVKQLTEGFSWFWEIIKWIGIALAVVGAILLGVSAWPAIIVGAIIGVITLLIVLIKDNWKAICDFFVAIPGWFNTYVIQPVASFFKNLWEGIVNGVTIAIDAICNFFSSIPSWFNDNIIQPIIDFFSPIASWINNNVIQPIINFFTGLWDKISNGVVKAFNAVTSWIYNNVIQPVANFFVGLWNGIVKSLTTAFSAIADWVYNKVIAPIVGFVTTYIIPIVSKIIEIVAKIIEIIVVLFVVFVKWIYNSVILPIVDFFVNLWNTVVEGVKSFIETVKNVFFTVVDWIYNNIILPIGNFFVNLWDSIVKGVTSFIESVKRTFFTVVSWISTNIITPVKNFFINLWNSIVQGVQTAIETVKNVFFTIVDWISTNIITPIGNFFVNLWNGIVNGVTTAIESIKNAFFTIIEWIGTNIITPIGEFFTGLWEGIVNGFYAFIEAIQNAFTIVVEWISTNVITPIADFFTNLWESVKTAFDTVADTVTGVFKAAVNAVLDFICGIINGVIKGINKAIDVINAIPGVSIEKLTLLELPKLAKGGVVDSATTAVIGEAGAEAVVPLENNLGWLEGLASKLVPLLTAEHEDREVVVSTSVGNTSTSTNQYLTSNYNTVQGGNTDNSSNKEETHIDNSVTFEAGSIVIQLANSTESELEKVAEKLMKIIARKQQLKAMAVRV